MANQNQNQQRKQQPARKIAERVLSAPNAALMVSQMWAVGIKITPDLQAELASAIQDVHDPFVQNRIAAFVNSWITTTPAKPRATPPTPEFETVGNGARSEAVVSARVQQLIQSLQQHNQEMKQKSTLDQKKAQALQFLDAEIQRLEKLPGRTPVNDQATMNFGKRGLLEWTGAILFGADELNEWLNRSPVVINMNAEDREKQLKTMAERAFKIGLAGAAAAGLVGMILGGVIGGVVIGSLGGVLFGALVGLVLSIWAAVWVARKVIHFLADRSRAAFYKAFPQLNKEAFHQRFLKQCETVRKLAGITYQQIRDFGLVQKVLSVSEMQMSKEGYSFKRYDEYIDEWFEEWLDSHINTNQPVQQQTPTGPTVVNHTVNAVNAAENTLARKIARSKWLG